MLGFFLACAAYRWKALAEAVILSTGMSIPAQWTHGRRCRCRADASPHFSSGPSSSAGDALERVRTDVPIRSTEDLCRAMAHIVLAYIVMAHIVMAYMAMGYIVMAYIVMALMSRSGPPKTCCRVGSWSARRSRVAGDCVGRFDGESDGRFDGGFDGRFDGESDGRFDGGFDGKFDGRFDGRLGVG